MDCDKHGIQLNSLTSFLDSASSFGVYYVIMKYNHRTECSFGKITISTKISYGESIHDVFPCGQRGSRLSADAISNFLSSSFDGRFIPKPLHAAKTS